MPCFSHHAILFMPVFLKHLFLWANLGYPRDLCISQPWRAMDGWSPSQQPQPSLPVTLCGFSFLGWRCKASKFSGHWLSYLLDFTFPSRRQGAPREKWGSSHEGNCYLYISVLTGLPLAWHWRKEIHLFYYFIIFKELSLKNICK